MLEQAVRMRLRGEHFFSRFTFTHPGLVRILKTAAENLEIADARQRRTAFERLAKLEGISDARGRPIRGTANDRARASTLALIARLSEAPVACTQEERRLFELLFERVLHGSFEAAMTGPSPSGFVPDACDGSSGRDAFVIWAPLEPAWRTALAAYALDHLEMRVIVVCRDGTLPNVHAEFVRPESAFDVLTRARAVLDLSVNDPGDALALARLGLPLAVSYLSGAYEFLDGVAIYRSWMQNDIELAALTALGLRRPRVIGPVASAPAVHEPPSNGPRVAIEGAPDAWERQTYRNLGPSGSATYIASIPSGATMFEMHVALLVEALERSGADRAVSDGIQRVATEPEYTLADGAFTVTRAGTQGQSMVRVPRITGLIVS